MQEATLLFQWGAPAHILGEPPSVHARRDMILGSSGGDYGEYVKRLETLMREQYQDESSVTLRGILAQEQVIIFYLDAEEFTEWGGLVYDGSVYRLLIDSTYVVAGDAAS